MPIAALSVPALPPSPPSGKVPAAPSRLRLWLALVAAGLLGFALATPYFFQVFQALAAKAGKPLPPTPLLFLAEGLKMLVLCGGAAWAGLVCAPRVGLDRSFSRPSGAGSWGCSRERSSGARWRRSSSSARTSSPRRSSRRS